MKRFFFGKFTGSASSSKNVKYVCEDKENSLRVFTYGELKDATKSFSTIHKIGEGSNGDFYEGSILPPNGKGHPHVVAIKTLHPRNTHFYVRYGDLKSSSVLLDLGFEPKLSGFGLAREGPKGHEMGNDHYCVVHNRNSFDYTAPEYILTGHKYVESDMWSFGVILYEILTGRRATERNPQTGKTEMKLVEWVKRYPIDSPTFSCMLDQRLKNQYSMCAARKIANLANRCVNINTKDRPSMTQIVEALEQVLYQYDL